MPSPSRTRVLTATTVAALLVMTGCAQSPAGETAPPPATPAAVVVTGTVGVVDFTNGYISIGHGSTVVDSYFDLMCPYCQEFEAANGDYLAGLVASGEITLRLHPLVFLDRLSMGTEYSTRSTNAFVAVAAASPESTLPYLQLLYKNKPAENAIGLTDDELAALASQAGGNSSIAFDAILRDRPYAAWSAANTAAAMAPGGITGADVTLVEHVPLTMVNGHSYTGDLSDAPGFAAFLTSH
jgi:protein-disulfide isomerase